MLSMALLQIVLRNVFDISLLWIEPFIRILVLWVAMLGAMVATRQGHHISIDVVARYVPARMERVGAIVTSTVSGVICLVIAWTSIEFIQYEYEYGTIAFAFVPTWVCQAILPFGFAVMGLRFIVAALLRLLGRD